jgi:ABC-type transport system involved in cytochrome c biogenesis permease subunit
VSNLYETFIFVALVSVLLGFMLEAVNKNKLGITVANVCGLIFLLVAAKFAAEGDTLRVLVAVLDSNFWLSTHVLSITTGYAGSCVAAIMGHIYILQACADSQNKKRLETTYKNMVGILGFGLTVTFLGTALGGIWADQSWGRFWGWDPKENGALLIVLWAAVLFHARMAKLIHPLGMAAGCVLCGIVVMWAWFGVNLLSVGLHSYGFTSGIATALLAYVIFEFIFLVITLLYLGKKGIKI